MKGVKGEVVNHKYWQRLKPVETKTHNSKPTKEAIAFERHLQHLERENRMFEMGLAMKRASISTNKDPVCSIEAIKTSSLTAVEPAHDTHWYLTKDRLVDDDTDRTNDAIVATVTKFLAIDGNVKEDNSKAAVNTT